MKKQYERPELRIESFDVKDVITASGFLANAANTLYELAHNAAEFFNSIGGGDQGGQGGEGGA